MRIDEFFPFVLPEVPGCPDPTLRQAIVMACIDFTRETLAWTELQDPVSLIDGEPDYEIDVPSGAYLLTVRDVWCGNRRMEPRTMGNINASMPDWQTAQSNEPSYYTQAVTRGSLRLFPTPANTSGATIVVRAAYTPTVSATFLPDFLGQRHMDVIASGAKSRLMLMAGASWFSEKSGIYYKQIFENGIVKSRAEEAHDRVRGTITVAPRSFGF